MDFNEFTSEFLIAFVVAYTFIIIFRGLRGSAVPFFTPNKRNE